MIFSWVPAWLSQKTLGTNRAAKTAGVYLSSAKENNSYVIMLPKPLDLWLNQIVIQHQYNHKEIKDCQFCSRLYTWLILHTNEFTCKKLFTYTLHYLMLIISFMTNRFIQLQNISFLKWIHSGIVIPMTIVVFFVVFLQFTHTMQKLSFISKHIDA